MPVSSNITNRPIETMNASELRLKLIERLTTGVFEPSELAEIAEHVLQKEVLYKEKDNIFRVRDYLEMTFTPKGK